MRTISAPPTLPGISAAELTIANAIFVERSPACSAPSAQGFNHTSPTSGYVPNVPEQYTPIQQNLAFYGQDNWKIRRNLTLHYGVRWEYQGPYNARNGLVLLPQNNISESVRPDPGHRFAGRQSVPARHSAPRHEPASDAAGRQQRASRRPTAIWTTSGRSSDIAYTPFNDGKTVIRAPFRAALCAGRLHFLDACHHRAIPACSALLEQHVPPAFSPHRPSAAQRRRPAAGSSRFRRSPTGQQRRHRVRDQLTITNLETPYVLDWGFGIQRELWKKFAIETRYVGNHAVKQYRTWSINELDLNNNGLLHDFNNAQNNYNIDAANGISGTFRQQQPARTGADADPG